jgi:tRNA-dihydrouridine synthase
VKRSALTICRCSPLLQAFTVDLRNEFVFAELSLFISVDSALLQSKTLFFPLMATTTAMFPFAEALSDRHQQVVSYHKTDLVGMIRDAQDKMKRSITLQSQQGNEDDGLEFNQKHMCNKKSETSSCSRYAPSAPKNASVKNIAEACGLPHDRWGVTDGEVEETSPLASSPPTAASASSAFSYADLVKIQAPMVRCSRPAFRKLCRLWGTTISYTHMIMSESFSQSADARASDFSLYSGEDRLVVQLAGTSGPTMGAAAAMLSPYCDAIDINCGCPQKWAMKEGIGAALLAKPEMVAEMVKSIWNAVPGQLTPCVVKMRVYENVEQSVAFARQVEAAGASWITVHGRTPWDSPSAIVRTSAITLIRDSVRVPVVANGSVECPRSAMGLALSAGVGSVMSARGLLSNPAAFFDPAESQEALTFPTVPRGVSAGTAGQSPPSSLGRRDFEATNPATAAHVSAALNLPGHYPSLLRTLSSSTMCPLEVISDFLRLAAVCDLPLKATQHHLLLMAHAYLSPLERSYLSQLRSNVALVRAVQSAGLFVAGGNVSWGCLEA